MSVHLSRRLFAGILAASVLLVSPMAVADPVPSDEENQGVETTPTPELDTTAPADSTQGTQAESADGESATENTSASEENTESDADTEVAPASAIQALEGGDIDQGNVTFIIQLDKSASSKRQHDRVKKEIAGMVDDLPDEIPLESAGDTDVDDIDDAPSLEETYEPEFADKGDFFKALNATSVTAPARLLSDIENIKGVKNVFVDRVIYADLSAPTSLRNAAALDMMGATDVNERGTGQSIAIIDSALDTDHEVFSGALNGQSVAFSSAQMSTLRSKLVYGKTGRYISTKIPFVYDYADGDFTVDTTNGELDHGTHVAGIATANAGSIRGTAPNAQLLFFKVARDRDGGIPTSTLLQALEDVAVIQPDAVNMSLGTDAGASKAETTVFGEVYAKLRSLGTTVNVAASNAFSSGYKNQSGQNLPYVSDPDSSTVGEPASFTESFAVASVDANGQGAAQSVRQLRGAGRTISYVESVTQNNTRRVDLTTLTDGDYPVVDGGVGSKADVQRLAASAASSRLAGSIVLVKRGGTENGATLTFSDKVANITASLTPAAVIIYNNDEAAMVAPGLTANASIPVIGISKADGEALLSAANKNLTLGSASVQRSVTMSSFSSWGVRPDGALKPEISAPGGGIYSSVLNNNYGEMSGTSMAAPQIAGITALMHEHLKNDADFARLSDKERANRVTQILMSTAVPVRDTADTSSYISPRKQGSGLVDVPAAMKTKVYATVKGQAEQSRPKADLGDGTKGWTYTVTLHNAGATDATFNLESVALSEKVANGFFQEHSTNWTNKGINVSHSTGQVTVPAHGSADVTVKIAIGQEFHTWAKNAPNGTFIDGFTFFHGANGAGELSVPFCGFYGDWGTIPVFDASSYNGNAHMYASYLSDYSQGTKLGYGSENRTYASYIMPMTGTLRTVDKLTYTYRNSAGNVVKQYAYDNVPKSLYVPQYGKVFNVEAYVGQPVFTGSDERNQRLADGEYTLTIDADVAGSSKNQQLIYGFHYGRTSGSYVTSVRTAIPQAGEVADPDTTPVRPDPTPSPTTPAPTTAPPSPTPTASAEPTTPAPAPTSTAPARPGVKKGSDTISIRRGTRLYIKNTISSSAYADAMYSFLRTTDSVYAGDWDGDGVDTVVLRRGNTFYIIDNLATAHVAQTITFGEANDAVIVGDWNGDGRDSLALRRGETFYFLDSLDSTSVSAQVKVGGSAGLEVVSGDWDGDGVDTLAFRSGRSMILMGARGSSGTTTVNLPYGISGTVIAGDWNGDGIDSFGVRNGGWYYLADTMGSQNIDRVAYIGNSSDEALVGNWNGK